MHKGSGIMSTREFREALANGRYAWPGRYPLFLVTLDGAAICFDCMAKERARFISQARAARWAPQRFHDGGFTPAGIETNWEKPELYCDHCSARIESAYAEPEKAAQ